MVSGIAGKMDGGVGTEQLIDVRIEKISKHIHMQDVPDFVINFSMQILEKEPSLLPCYFIKICILFSSIILIIMFFGKFSGEGYHNAGHYRIREGV